MSYFPLNVTTGRYVRFTYTASSSADNRVADVHLFGTAPILLVPSGTVILLR